MAVSKIGDSIVKALEAKQREMWEQSEFSAFAVIQVVGHEVVHSLVIKNADGTEHFREEFRTPIDYETPFEIALPIWPTFITS